MTLKMTRMLPEWSWNWSWKQWPADWVRMVVSRCPLVDTPGNEAEFVSAKQAERQA